MKRVYLCTFGLLGVSVAWAADTIKWFDYTGQIEDLSTLENQQYVIQFDDGHGFTHTGMGFSLSDSRILTASHLFPYGKIGDLVRIGSHQGMNSMLNWQDGKITQLDPSYDFAAIKLAEQVTTHTLPECPTAPLPGSPVVVYKPSVENNMVVGGYINSAIVTALCKMPKTTVVWDEKRPPGTYSLQAQSGGRRLVAAGSSDPGVSGGAIWDVKRKCVAGIASAVIPFKHLEDRQSTLEQAGNPPYSSFLIGIPVPLDN